MSHTEPSTHFSLSEKFLPQKLLPEDYLPENLSNLHLYHSKAMSAQKSLEGSRILLTSFTISTWLTLGACVQCLLFLLLPRYVALLPAFVLLASRAINAAIITQGWAKNPYLPPDELMRKMTAPIPNEDGTKLVKAGEREVVCFLVGAQHSQ